MNKNTSKVKGVLAIIVVAVVAYFVYAAFVAPNNGLPKDVDPKLVKACVPGIFPNPLPAVGAACWEKSITGTTGSYACTTKMGFVRSDKIKNVCDASAANPTGTGRNIQLKTMEGTPYDASPNTK